MREPLSVDVSLLASSRRDISTAVATWLRGRLLGDGSEPGGIRFTSKHGQDLTCWAIWVPLLGEQDQARVPSLVSELAAVDAPQPLLKNTPALLTASRLLGVRVH